MSELTKEKIYKKELEKVGGVGNNNLERIRSLAGGVALEDIVDKNGNPRFIEGNGTPLTLEGFTSTYCKWSLSGTHLMIVLAGTFANTTAVADGTVLASFNIPDFILNKIYPVWDISKIEMKNINMYASNWSTQTLTTAILKYNGLQIVKSGGSTLTLTADRSFRIQFDLLIDSE